MNFCCTSNTVASSFSSAQLQEAWPGLTRALSKAMAGAARSVPRVDSVTVARLPSAITRHGDMKSPRASASRPPPVKTSAAIGTPSR
jgi:hypothetical protein